MMIHTSDSKKKWMKKKSHYEAACYHQMAVRKKMMTKMEAS